MCTKFIPFILLLHSPPDVLAQQAWFEIDTVTNVAAGGANVINPWTGGFNAPQYLKMHLNDDLDEDLIVYERTNSKVTTFLVSSGSSPKKTFVHTPCYETLFPRANGWMILADYDADGRKELFTSTPEGIAVYRQVNSGNAWSWRLARGLLYTVGFSSNINMHVSGPDIPAITDVDDDGDLDVLTYDLSGSYIELHQNLSMEKFGVPDSLGSEADPVFMRNGDCWGNFYKGNGEDFVIGADCGVAENPSVMRVMHAGNSILLHDLNGDGKKDLLIAPAFDGSRSDLLDIKSTGWYYRNKGTSENPSFQLVQKNFLQDQTIDVGENAAPTFLDIDGDGDLDMLIGTGGTQLAEGFKGSIWLLRNIGTAASPHFSIESQDF